MFQWLNDPFKAFLVEPGGRQHLPDAVGDDVTGRREVKLGVDDDSIQRQDVRLLVSVVDGAGLLQPGRDGTIHALPRKETASPWGRDCRARATHPDGADSTIAAAPGFVNAGRLEVREVVRSERDLSPDMSMLRANLRLPLPLVLAQ